MAINAEESFSPASLIKLPVAFTIYKLAESDPSFLNRVVINELEDTAANQNIKPEVLLKKDASYTVGELVEYMLVYSNNRACDLLLTLLQTEFPEHMGKVYSDLNIQLDPSVNTNPSGNIITVKQYASFFRILYNSSYVSKDYSERLLMYLNSTSYTKGLVAGIPADVGVAHKYGERYYEKTGERQLHDCGIVYAKPNPYLLCIMTRGKEFNVLQTAIQELAHITHTTISKQNAD